MLTRESQPLLVNALLPRAAPNTSIAAKGESGQSGEGKSLLVKKITNSGMQRRVETRMQSCALAASGRRLRVAGMVGTNHQANIAERASQRRVGIDDISGM